MTTRLTRRVPAALTALLDLVAVVVFAAVGRRSHAETGDIAGVATTAWPFLVGAAIGWVVYAAWRRQAPCDMTGGVVVWVCTVVGGMLLRVVIGAGTAWTFVLVASIATAVVLLGWRAIARVIVSRRDPA